jgi:translation initiation factor IF-2
MEGGHDFTPHPEKAPETLPAFSGGPPQPPPRPPKLTARDLLEPGDPGRTILIGNYIQVAELAELLGLKPFKIVAELLEMRIFKHADEFINFDVAAKIASGRGFVVERVME